MAEQDDKCSLCGEQMLSLACPGGCFIATAHEVDGLVCKDRQRAESAAGTIRAANAEDYMVMVEGIENVLCGGEPVAVFAPTAVPSAFDTDLREYVRVITQEDIGNLCINVSDGRRLLVEIDRLRRLEAAVEDDSLMRVFYKDSGHADVTKLILCSYRDALLAGEPEAEKPHGPTCVELTTAFRDIQRLLTEYLVPDGCNAHETITKILAITDTKPFSQLRRETHDETRI